MCEYCRSWPDHLFGCPNAPDTPRYTVPCPVCGEKVEPDDLIEGVCPKCMKRPRTFEEYLPFLRENALDFAEWWYSLEGLNTDHWSPQLRKTVCSHLFEVWLQEYQSLKSPEEREGFLKVIREYTETADESWAEWLRREGV